MFKLLILCLFAIHCNCQKVYEITGADVQRRVDLSNGFNAGLNRVQTLGTLGSRYSGLGGLQTVGVQRVAGVDLSGLSGLSSVGVQPVGLGLGYGIGGLRSNALNFGVGQVGVHPVGLGVVQHAGQTVAVQPALGVSALGLGLGGLGHTRVALAQQTVPVSAAVHQVGRTVEYRPVPYNDEQVVPQVVEVEPSDVPVRIHFKSRSSTVQLSQEHIPGAPGTVQHTSSQDEPSKVIHEVVKPVIQEVREVIQPYRQVSQEVQPVVESVHTTVAKGEGERRQFLAQPLLSNVQTLGALQQYGVSQGVRTVAQPVYGQSYHSQPVYGQSYQSQPVVGYEGVGALGLTQQQLVSQPFASRYSVSQPAYTIGGFRSGALLSNGGYSSGLVSGHVGNRFVGSGHSYLTNSHTVPSTVTYQQQLDNVHSDHNSY